MTRIPHERDLRTLERAFGLDATVLAQSEWLPGGLGVTVMPFNPTIQTIYSFRDCNQCCEYWRNYTHDGATGAWSWFISSILDLDGEEFPWSDDDDDGVTTPRPSFRRTPGRIPHTWRFDRTSMD